MKIQVVETEAATFEVTERKATIGVGVVDIEATTFEVTKRKVTTRVGESKLKRGFLTFFSHSKRAPFYTLTL